MMSWLAVIGLALAAFALGALALGLARGLWSTLLAALALGLAGYGMQASPGLPSAPAAGRTPGEGAPFDLAEARAKFIAPPERSASQLLMVADAMVRQDRYQEAVTLLAGATRADPKDFEAWLALGNALVEHTQGVLTPPALYAYRQAALLSPAHIAPNYFLGVALIRQGNLIGAAQIWRDALEQAPDGVPGRTALAEGVARIENVLDMFAAMPQGGQAGLGAAPAAPSAP